jgi:hypothetical protein
MHNDEFFTNNWLFTNFMIIYLKYWR